MATQKATLKKELTTEQLAEYTAKVTKVFDKIDFSEGYPSEFDTREDFNAITALAGIPAVTTEEGGKLVTWASLGDDPYVLEPVTSMRATKKVLKLYNAKRTVMIADDEVDVY